MKAVKRKLERSNEPDLFTFGFTKSQATEKNVSTDAKESEAEMSDRESKSTALVTNQCPDLCDYQDKRNSSPTKPGPSCPVEEKSESLVSSEQVQPDNTSSNLSEENPFTDEECLNLVKQLFEDKLVTKCIHNKYLCLQNFCTDISSSEKRRLLPKRFSHNKLNIYWWLCFLEGEGMYCLVCKKFNAKHTLNKRDIFVNTPSTRFLEDALKCHATSRVHRASIETELVQKMSVFHKEIVKKDSVEMSVYEKIFWTAYFLMKNFIPNSKLLPLLDMIEGVYDDDLKYFEHRSAGVQREIFTTLGESVKELVVNQVKKADAFGLLTDEVSDISVTEHLVTFIQYLDKDAGQVKTSFLSCQNILENFSSANACAISDLLVESIRSCELDIGKLTGFASDGASVMMGQKGGVATLLRKQSPTLINIHCICHRLALSCTDSNESIKYIKETELILRQLWTFFDNSPKKMAAYLKTQLELKKLDLSKGASKTVASKLKKACRTRWLSLDSSVSAVYNDYEAVLQTLSQCQDEDATALGLLKKIKTIKFLGVIYILKDVLTILSALSRTFQKDSLSFSAIVPQINSTKDKLDQLLQDETPLAKLQSDIDSITNISIELSLSKKHFEEIQSLFRKYITALKRNIDIRFCESSEVVSAFCIFDPLALPEDKDEFKEYGVQEIETLGSHFFRGEESESTREQVCKEWGSMKWHMKDVLKPKVPEDIRICSVKSTSTEWCLLQLLTMPVYKTFFPRLSFIAEAAACLPVTNAWPERGASALKIVKTRLRNRIKNDMLEALLQVSVNGPTCKDGEKVVKHAVSKWLKAKVRRKLAKKAPKLDATIKRSVEASCQTDPVIVADQHELRDEIKAAVKSLALEGVSSEMSESDFTDDSGDESL